PYIFSRPVSVSTVVLPHAVQYSHEFLLSIVQRGGIAQKGRRLQHGFQAMLDGGRFPCNQQPVHHRPERNRTDLVGNMMVVGIEGLDRPSTGRTFEEIRPFLSIEL